MTAAIATHLQIIRSAAHELELEADRFERESGVMPAADTAPEAPSRAAISPPPMGTIPSPPPVTDDMLAGIGSIPAGSAAVWITGAAIDVLVAFDRLQKIASAVGRQLDDTVKPKR